MTTKPKAIVLAAPVASAIDLLAAQLNEAGAPTPCVRLKPNTSNG
jgi:hypothetical protein